MARKSRKKVDTRLRPNFVRAWREVRGITQEALAEMTGMAVGSISQIEWEKQFSLKSLRAIAHALNVEPGWLLSRDPDDPEDIWTLAEQLTRQEPPIREALRRMLAPTADSHRSHEPATPLPSRSRLPRR